MEDTLIPDLETGDVIINDVVSSQNDDDRSSGPENDYERRGAVGVDSEKSTGGESEEMHRPLEMEKGAEKGLEVNRSVATNDVALSQSDELLINQTGVVGIDSNKSTVEEITEMLKLLKVEEDSGENLEVNISDVANDVALSQSDDLLIAVSSSSTLVDDRSSGPRNGFELRGAVEIDSDISSGEETKETNVLLEMEASAEKDLEVNGSGAATGATLSQVNDFLINQVEAVGTESDTSIGDDINETGPGKDYEMEESAEKDLEVNGSGAANSVTLSLVNDLLINQVGAVGTEADTSVAEDIEETSAGKDYEMEESAEKDLEVNGSGAADSVTLSQVNDLLINQVGAAGTESDTSIGEDIEEMSAGNDYEMEESAEKDLDVNGSGVASSATLSQVKDLEVNGSGAADSVTLSQVNDLLINQVGAAGTESDTSIGEDIEEMSAGNDYEMEESAEKDLDVNGSGVASSATLSQVNDLLINQVGAVGTESDTSILDDIKETSPGKDYEMEKNAEKDLEVNGSGAASSATLSQVNDLLISQAGAVGTESDTSIGDDIKETSPGKDYEVNISVAANDVALSCSDDIVINHIGAVGIEFNKTTDAEIKEMPKLMAMEESSGNDIETNISVANNDVALSQSDDLLIAVSSPSSTIIKDQSSDEYITQPKLLEMEESAGKHPEMNRSSAANNVPLSLGDDLLINQIGADGIDSNKSTIEEIKEKPKIIEVESFGSDLEANISVADNDVTSSTSSDLLITVSSLSTLSDDQSSGEDIKEPELLNMEENSGNDLEVNTLSAAKNVALSQSTDLLNHNGVVGTDFNRSASEVIKEMPKLPELEEGAMKDPETNISVADNDVALCQGDDLLITVSSSSMLYHDQSSGEDIKEHELLNMEENAGNDLKVNTLTAANDVALSQSTDLLNHGGVVGTDFNRSACEFIKVMPKLPESEEGAVKDPETNISVANNDVALCQGDDLMITVSSSSTLSDNQSSGEDTKKMPIVLETEDNAGKDLEMHQLEAVNNAGLSQSQDVLITISSFPSTLSDQQSSGHGNETSSELIGAVEIDADKPGSEETLEMPKLLVTPEPEKSGKNVKFNLRKSLAWDSAFFTSDGVLDADELSTMMEGGVKNARHQLPGIEEEVYRSMDSISTLESDNLSLECLEAELFEDIRASIQKSNRSSSNLNNSSIKVSSGKKDSQAKVISWPWNGFELRGAVEIDSDISSGEETKETNVLLEMEASAEKDLEVNGSGAATGATLSQVNDFLINQVEAVGTESDTSIGDDIKETSPGKDYEMEESAEKDLEVNGSGAANSVTLSLVNDLLINQVGAVGTEADTSVAEDIEETSAGKDYEMEESAEKDLEVNGSGAANSVTLSQVNDLLINQVGAAGTESDTSIGEDIEEMSAGNDYEMEESAEKDLDVNGSGVASSATSSQVNDLLINQVGAVGTESDTSIVDDIKETSPGKDYEMEKNAEKDLEVNGSGAASSATLSQVNDLLISQAGAVGTESDTSIGDDIKETSPGKDYEVNISVAANDVAISCSDDIVINHIGAVGIEFNKTTDAEIKEMPKLLAMEESSGNDLETNISVANNDVALSQSDDLLIAVSSPSSKIFKDQSSDEYITQPELLEMEESAGKHPEMNRSSAANNVPLSLGDDLLINQIGADGIDSNKSTIEEIKEKPKFIEVERFGNDLEANISVADNDVTSSTSSDLLITVSSLSTLSDDQSSGEDIKEPELLNMEENSGNDLEVNTLSAAKNVALSQSTDLLNHNGVVGTDFNRSASEVIKEMPKLPELEEGAMKDPETNISVADNDVALCQGDDLMITVSSSSTLSDNQSSGEDIKEHELLNMEENAGNDLKVNTLTAASDVALSQSTDLLNHSGVVGTDFNRSACEVIKVMPKLPELEEGAVKDPETNISVANNDVTLCQGDDLMITVSSSSPLSDNQSSGEDTKKMPIVLETEDNAGKDLEMHQLEAVNNAGLSQSQDVLITISSFPSTLSDQQSSGHGNETSSELIGAVEIDADKPGSEETLEMPKLLVTPEPEKSGKNVKFNLRKSLAWDNAFFTSDGVLDADELSTMMEGGVKNARHQLPGIEEEVYRSMDSISTLESDNLSLECLEAELFEDIRASIQKSNRSSSNLNNSSIKVSSGKKDSQAKVISSSKKVDTDSGNRPAARMKHTTSSIPQPKIVSRVNSSSTLTLTKRASLSANHAKKDQDIARQPHAVRATTQGSKLIGPHRGVPKPSLSSKASPMGSSTALTTEPTRPSSSHSNSSSCSSGTDVKSSTTLSRKKIDSKCSKLTTTAVPKTPSRVIMKNKPQPPANSRVSSHSVLSTVSSSISPASSISEWSSESSSSSTTNNNQRSELRGSTGTNVSHRSLDNDASGQSASNMRPTGRISNQIGNQPISQSGSLARPPCIQPTELRMPSPKLGLFDGGKSGARTPNGGNIRPQSKLPTGIPKIEATHSNPQPPANSRVSSHSVLSTVSSSISPASSISEWSSESSSSTTNNNRRSESRGSTDTIVSYRSLDNDASGQSASNILPTGRISNQNGNQPISQSGSLARPPCVQSTGLRMPSPKIGFFDGGKSGARTPNGGNIRPQSKLPTGIPKIGATHSNPIISNGVKSGKIPPPKTGAAHTIMKPNPQKAAPKPSQEQPKTKSSLVTSDASNTGTDGSRTPFAVKNSEAY